MMRIIILIITTTFFNSVIINAQDKPAALIRGEEATVNEHLLKLEIGIPNAFGISYEKKIDKHISIYNILGFWAYGGGGLVSQSIYGVSPYYVVMPQLTVQPRYYHNLSRRAANDKNIKYNSANYVGIAARLYSQSFSFTNALRNVEGPAVLDLMLSYGLQRSFSERFNLDMAVQPGIEIASGQASFFVGINFQLGFIVFGK